MRETDFFIVFIHYFNRERKVSRVLVTSSEQFNHTEIQRQKLSTQCLSWVIRQNVFRQLATSSEILVTNIQFLVALATSESQLQALDYQKKKNLVFMSRQICYGAYRSLKCANKANSVLGFVRRTVEPKNPDLFSKLYTRLLGQSLNIVRQYGRRTLRKISLL